jgi:hypothetical protein
VTWLDELPEPLRLAAIRNAEERTAQGLSAHVDDPVVAARLARILSHVTEEAA